ncbi:glycosyltransferase [Paraburkholderia fungorum]|nr:glycosyltransferase [Paraburkholderia fungorum]
MKNKDILYSGFSWEHHDGEAGYHHVVMSKSDYVDGGALWGSEGSVRSLKRRINFVLTDMLTIVRAVPYRAVLLFYPEQTSYLSPMILRLMGKKVVYVIHLGEDYWLQDDGSLIRNLKRFNLRFVSKFITLTVQQSLLFEERFPGRVVKIPHGAWCRKRERAGAEDLPHGDRTHIIVVGDTYRDYALLTRIVQFFAQHFPFAHFDLVGMKSEKLGEIQDYPNVTCFGWLDNVQYERTIRNALFMLLPLEFATANNALLEGLKSGVPVICSAVSGVREYLPQGDYVFSSVGELASKFEQRRRLTQSERDCEAEMLVAYAAEHYSWEVIRDRVANYCLS